ncbi:major facilitator superfamily transporter [Phlyctema vagabunda]|uniref:Major facilitator superfamily transporter n=1 Tax=Phlyctema vagabunda TaxID=108571 RepID=A0ABR4PP81_9HELO
MSKAFFRSSLIGHLIWLASKPQWLAYGEERKGFQVEKNLFGYSTSQLSDEDESSKKTQTPQRTNTDTEKGAAGADANSSRRATRQQLSTSQDGTIVVDWYSADDPENPQNWTVKRKAFVLLCIASYSFVVYMGAPIYTPSIDEFKEEFNVDSAYASLGLALYVLGYGFGPLIFAPLSEIPSIGRALPYPATFLGFVLTSIGAACTKSASGFMFLRFLQGFFGSPALATGGASIADVFSPVVLPHAMTSWVLACYCAPAFSPVLAGFAIPVLGWRFSMWELCIASAPVMALLCFLPETMSSTILLGRARRLRQVTGNMHYKGASEIAMHKFSFAEVVYESLLVPTKITFLDPAMLFTNLYLTFIYGIYYSFFEVFPLVYSGIYGFNLGESGLPFLAIVVGAVIAFLIYNVYVHKVHVPLARSGETSEPEDLLIPALYSCFLPPIGLFLFGWAANESVHWIVPTIGIVIFPWGVFIVMQCVFVYVPAVYPQYAASIFAAQDFTRCVFACGAVIIARPMFHALGIGGGCSFLAGLMILCILGMHLLYRFGGTLRKRSKFVSKW